MAKINLDVDGVVCDFVPGLFDILGTKGFEPLPHTDPVWRTWDIFKVMQPEMRATAFEIMAKPEFWRDLPAIDFAQEAVEQLRKAGHRIHWITTAWDGCFGWRDARRDWLDDKFGGAASGQNIAKDLTVTGEKGETWADVFVDDKPQAIMEWHKHHPAPNHRAILYKTSFNHAHHEDLEHFEWEQDSVDMLIEWLADKYPEQL